MTRRLPILIGVLSVATAFQLGTAEAGHGGGGHFSGGGGGGVHFSGGVHVGGGGVRAYGGVHVGGGGGFAYRGHGYGGRGWGGGYHWGVGGHVWVGGYPYWYNPYAYYYPEYVPSYYGSSYYPVQPGYGAPAISAAVIVQQPLPRFGVGVFGGMADVNNAPQNSATGSSDYGLLARFRLTEGLIIEGELGKTTYQSNERVDRRLGGSLLYEIGARNKFAPYVLVGLGVQQANVDGDYNTTQDFAEIGAGLRYAITPHFHITFDIRAGSRSTVSQDQSATVPTGASARVATPPPANSGDSEDYTRGRLAAILYF